MGLVSVQGQLGFLVHVGLQVRDLRRSLGIGHQRDAVEGFQGFGVFLALEHRHAALVVGEVAGLGHPLDVQHRSDLVVVADVLVHAEAVVGTGGGVLGTVDRDGERHVGDIVGVVTGGLHLDDGPASQHHAADLAVVDHGLAALPVGGGGVFLGQTHGHGVIQDLVHGVGAGAVAAVREGILGLGHRDVHPVGIAGGAARNIGVPGGHGPAGGKVGVQGDGVGFVLDELQVGEELIGGLGQLRDAGGFKDGLVVDDALRVAGGGDAVDILAEGAVVREVVLVLDLVQLAQHLEVIAQLGQGDGGGDHADVAPVIAGQAGGHVLGIVGDAFVGDADVGVELLELGHITVKGAVLDQVGALADELEVRLQVGVILAHLEGRVAGNVGRFRRAGGCGAAGTAAAACQQRRRHGSGQGQCLFHCVFTALSSQSFESSGAAHGFELNCLPDFLGKFWRLLPYVFSIHFLRI